MIGSIFNHLLNDDTSAEVFMRALSLAVMHSGEQENGEDLDLGEGMMDICRRLFQERVDPTKIERGVLFRLLPPFQQVLKRGVMVCSSEKRVLGCSISILAQSFAEKVYSSVFDPLWSKCSSLIQGLTSSEAPTDANVFVKELKVLIDIVLIFLEEPKVFSVISQKRLGEIQEAVFPSLLAYSDLQDVCVKLALALPKSEETLFFSLAYLQDLAFFPPQGSVNLAVNYVLLLRKIVRTQRLLLLRRVRAEIMKEKGGIIKGAGDERLTEVSKDIQRSK